MMILRIEQDSDVPAERLDEAGVGDGIDLRSLEDNVITEPIAAYDA